MHRTILRSSLAKYLAGFLITTITLSLISYGSDGFTAAYALSTWALKLGGPGAEDMFRGIEQSSDGEYVFVGETNSFGAGSNDAWLVKLAQDGKVDWQKTFGGKGGDSARVIRQTPDGGYAVAGQTHSFGSGSSDFWLLKFDSSDNLQWQKAYGGPSSDIAHALELTSDGGYLIAGFTTGFGAVSKDYLVIKLDPDGAIQWQKRYGASGEDVLRFAKQTSDGKYLIAGFTHSFGEGGDIMVLKLDESGNVEWQKRYGGEKFEEPGAILEVPGGYVVLEQTASFSGGTDGWIFKLDSDGNILWQKRYSGNGFDELSAARITPDGGFVVVGETRSFGLTTEDFWVLKFDTSANLEWQKRYGGQGIDEAEAVALTPEGGYIIAGITFSFNSIGKDIWIVRLDSNGDIAQCTSDVHAGIVTNAIIRDTTAVPINTNLNVADTSAAVRNSNASIKDSNANISFQCSPATLNTPPDADDDSYSTHANEQLIVSAPGVLDNDNDNDGDTLTALLDSEPTHGSLVLNSDGGFTYTPEEGYAGEDSFTYKASDGKDESGIATVTIAISASITPPIADNLNVSVEEDQIIEILLTGSDNEDPLSALTFYIASLPQHGGLSDTTPSDIRSLTYTPEAGFVGSDSFTFVIYDTDGLPSNSGSVSIVVSGS